MNEVAPKLTLQEKVSQRIKDQIGDMIEPEDLRKLVEQAMQDAFFKRKVIQEASYNRNEVSEPPLIVSTVTDLLKPMVDEMVKVWAKEHHEEIKSILDSVIRDGIVKMIDDSIKLRTQSDLYTFGNMISQKLTGRPL